MSRNRGQRRPTPPRATPLITVAEARDLASGLIRELAQHAGDPAAVRASLIAWLETEDVPRLSLIGLAVVQNVFSDCLTRVDDVPPGALALTAPTEGNTT